MNMIDTEPGFLDRTADADRTPNTIENVQEDTSWAVTRKETSEPYNEGLDHENLVVLPTHNEAEWLTSLVRHLLQLIGRSFFPYDSEGL